ncbi:hypothetical protein [Flavobacterium sp. AED]|uniref:hypothetical protein n=1 Tax=Flavobacterium sp. AED TaxID=1423323 RepID=UPI00057E8923|nr:hypothetical protein [Flavobacterium sp. AED]KIA85723.1 hypothetical protein OA85_10675 [Flavobacterium sp. AED]MDI1305817.1 hypothetical protein [bacterium]
MRVVVFFVYLCFHLLGGGSYLHADTNHSHISHFSTPNLVQNQQAKLTNKNQGSLVIEYTDLDLDEEYSSGNDIKDGVANKFFAEKDSLLHSWYLPVSQCFISNYYFKRFKIFMPFCGNSSAIYIINSVLRI